MVSSLLQLNEKLENFEDLKVYFQIPSERLDISLKTREAQLQMRCSEEGVSYLGWFSSLVLGMVQKAEEEVL